MSEEEEGFWEARNREIVLYIFFKRIVMAHYFFLSPFARYSGLTTSNIFLLLHRKCTMWNFFYVMIIIIKVYSRVLITTTTTVFTFSTAAAAAAIITKVLMKYKICPLVVKTCGESHTVPTATIEGGRVIKTILLTSAAGWFIR